MKAREAKELLTSCDEAPCHVRLASGEEVDLVSRDVFAEMTRTWCRRPSTRCARRCATPAWRRTRSRAW
jgi:hypothetical protein